MELPFIVYSILEQCWSVGYVSLLTLSFIISLVEFYKCIFWANVIDFENFKTVVVIIFLESFHPWKYCKVSHTTLTISLSFFKILSLFHFFIINQQSKIKYVFDDVRILRLFLNRRGYLNLEVWDHYNMDACIW